MNFYLKHMLSYHTALITEHGSWDRDSKEWGINLSSIATKLIQDTGRFCERFASDLLITWAHTNDWLKTPDLKGSTLVFGIRKDGVDHEPYVLDRLREHDDGRYGAAVFANMYYRKIYAVYAYNTNDTLYVELHDIQDNIADVIKHPQLHDTIKLNNDTILSFECYTLNPMYPMAEISVYNEKHPKSDTTISVTFITTPEPHYEINIKMNGSTIRKETANNESEVRIQVLDLKEKLEYGKPL